jgi:S1-C subfamily serine protease
VGLTLDRDHGLKVTKVAAGSAAATIGLQPGDLLASAGERKLFGQADFRGVLHRAPRGDAEVVVRWWRGTELLEGTLELKTGWRATRNGWRKSVAEADIGAHTGIGWPIAANAKLRAKFGVKADEMAISPWTGKKAQGAAYAAGMKRGEVVLAVNGETRPRLHGREFNAWWRIKFDPGDPVELTVGQPDGSRRKIRYRAPASYAGK